MNVQWHSREINLHTMMNENETRIATKHMYGIYVYSENLWSGIRIKLIGVNQFHKLSKYFCGRGNVIDVIKWIVVSDQIKVFFWLFFVIWLSRTHLPSYITYCSLFNLWFIELTTMTMKCYQCEWNKNYHNWNRVYKQFQKFFFHLFVTKCYNRIHMPLHFVLNVLRRF